MNTEQFLIDSFHATELKQSGSRSDFTAEQVKERIRARLQASATAADVEEFQFNLKNDWEMIVLQALLKRYGIKSYRYRKQRKSTVLFRVSKQFMDELLWPIFNDVAGKLFERFTQVTMGLLPAIAPGPFSMVIIDHEHNPGQLCENCQRLLREE